MADTILQIYLMFGSTLGLFSAIISMRTYFKCKRVIELVDTEKFMVDTVKRINEVQLKK